METIGYMWIPSSAVDKSTDEVENSIRQQYRDGLVTYSSHDEANNGDPEHEHRIYGEVPLKLIKITYEEM
jgi:hypothetical protein